jgi:hypothetical protein
MPSRPARIAELGCRGPTARKKVTGLLDEVAVLVEADVSEDAVLDRGAAKLPMGQVPSERAIASSRISTACAPYVAV